MGRDKNEQPDKLNSGERLDRELSQSCSNLWGAARATGVGGVYALYLRLKQGGVWVAVAKRHRTQDDYAMVAFGQGSTIGSALVALNKSVAADKWKRDLPYNGVG